MSVTRFVVEVRVFVVSQHGMVAASATTSALRMELAVEEAESLEALQAAKGFGCAAGTAVVSGEGVRRDHVRALPQWQSEGGYSPRCVPESSTHAPPSELFPPTQVSIQEDRSACRIWVGGIPEQLVVGSGDDSSDTKEPVILPRDSKLAKCFERFGEVVAVTLRRKPGPCKSWALVTFEKPEQARAALGSNTRYGSPPITLKVRRDDSKTQLQKLTTRALGAVCRTQQEAEESWFRTMLKSLTPMGAAGAEALVIHTPRASVQPLPSDAGQTRSASLDTMTNSMQFAVEARRTSSPSQATCEEQRDLVSVETQMGIAHDQLRLSEQSADLHAIAAALSTARNLAREHAQCKELSVAADQLESRLRKSDPRAGKKLELHRNEHVKRHVRRIWDLLLVECTASNDDGTLSVNLDGYCKLHICIGKALSEEDWDIAEARKCAHNDWSDDVQRFAEDSGINKWLAKVKQLLQDRVAESIATIGWQAMFTSLDANGDGKLDCEEFVAGIRTAGLDAGVCSDQQIKLMFHKADVDGGGEVDGREFADWVCSILKLDKRRQTQRVSVDRSTEVALRAVHKLQERTGDRIADLGWKSLFKSADTDGNGELDAAEFCAAMRTHGLSAQEVSDTQLGEVFKLIDADGGGTLCAEEFVASLRKNETAGHTMSPQAFEKSMFELADYWSKGTEEADYVHFFQTLFSAISEPLSGVQGYPFAVICNGKANYRLKDTKYIGSLVNVDGKFDGSMLTGMHESRLESAGTPGLPAAPPKQAGVLKPSPPSHGQTAADRHNRGLHSNARKSRTGQDGGWINDAASDVGSRQARKHNATLPWRAGTYAVAGHVSQSLGPAIDDVQTDDFYQPRVSAESSNNERSHTPAQRYVSVSARRGPRVRQALVSSARPRTARPVVNRSTSRRTTVVPQPARPRTSSQSKGASSWVPATTYLPAAASRRERKGTKFRPWPPPREVMLVEGTTDNRLLHTKQQEWQTGLRPRMSHMGRVLPWMMLAPCTRENYL